MGSSKTSRRYLDGMPTAGRLDVTLPENVHSAGRASRSFAELLAFAHDVRHGTSVSIALILLSPFPLAHLHMRELRDTDAPVFDLLRAGYGPNGESDEEQQGDQDRESGHGVL